MTVRVEKLVAFYTSRDRGDQRAAGSAGKSARRYPTFDEALDGHAAAWDELWEVCDLRLPSEDRVQFLLRFHAATSCRCARATRPITTPACWRAASTARRIAATSSGTSSSSTPS